MGTRKSSGRAGYRKGGTQGKARGISPECAIFDSRITRPTRTQRRDFNLSKKTELMNWLTRGIDEDVADALTLLRHFGTDPRGDVLERCVERKGEAYREIFPEGQTRKVWEIPAYVQVPTRYDLENALMSARSKMTASNRAGSYSDITDAHNLAINALVRYEHVFSPKFVNPYEQEGDEETQKPFVPCGEWKIPTMGELVNNRYTDGSKVLRYLISLIPTDQSLLRTTFESLVSQAIGTFRSSETVLVWSTSPLDLLLISEAGMCSCHSVNREDRGCHSGGTIAYMGDKTTSVLYTTKELRGFADLGGMVVPEKSQRALVYYDKRTGYTIQRMYPSYNDRVLETMQAAVREVLPDSLYPEEEMPCLESDSRVAYIDPSIAGMRSTGYHYIAGIGDGYCLDCGGSMDNQDGLTCLDCTDDSDCIYCARCGDRIDDYEAMRGADGEDYCQYCWDELYTCCSRCGSVVSIDDVTEVQGHGDWCPSCTENYAVECSLCGDYIHDEDVEFKLHDDGSIDYDSPICHDCWVETYVACSECGQIVHKEDAFRVDRMRYACKECYVPATQQKLTEDLLEVGGSPRG